VRVIDDGPGVSPTVAARLFEPFATGKAAGIGLGLAVARKIVERHGGSLDCVPTSRGACFEVRLPRNQRH
jgi:signal transduction histidine kinase